MSTVRRETRERKDEVPKGREKKRERWGTNILLAKRKQKIKERGSKGRDLKLKINTRIRT